MLQPKKTKFRKQQKGRIHGYATRGAEISFGSFALKSLEPQWITARQIEAARRAMTFSASSSASVPSLEQMNFKRSKI